MGRLRVLYVEDDPALMGLVSDRLRAAPSLDLVFAGGSFASALQFAQKEDFDAALLDMNLGQGVGSGLELATALRVINSNCGLVIFSQHASEKLVQRLPIDQRYSFSVLQKRAPLDFELLVTTLVRTAQGYSSHDQSLAEEQEADISLLSNLRLRDHEIMRMLTSGKSTDHIARELSLSPVTIRQDLSRIYETLIPQRTAGTNLRTLAISKYLADARSF